MSTLINFEIVFKVISRNLFILSAALFACVGVAVLFSEEMMPFLLSSLISLISGLLLFLTTRKR